MLKEKAQAYNGFGEIYRNRGLYSRALDAYSRALQIDQYLKDRVGMLRRYINMAMVATRQGRKDKALAYWKKTLPILKKEDHFNWLAITYTEMSHIFVQKGDLGRGTDYLNKAKEALRLTKDTKPAFLYRNLGWNCLSSKKHNEALIYFDIALRKYQKENKKPDIARVLILQGKTYTGLQNYPKALEHLQKGMQVAQEAGSTKYTREGAETLANVYEILGKDKEAIKFHKLFRETLDKANREVSKAKIEVLEIKYKLDRKRNEARRAKERMQEKIRREKEAQIALLRNLLVVLVTIVLLAFWIIQTNNNRKLKQTNQRTQFVNASLASALDVSKKQKQKIRQQNNKIRQAYQHVQDTNAALEDTLAISEHQQNKISLQNEQIQSVNSTLEHALQTSKRQQKKIGLQHTKIEESYQNTQRLASIGQKITSSLDLDKVLKDIYEEIKQLMDMTSFGIGSYSFDEQRIIPRLLVRNNQPLELSEEMIFHYSNILSAWCIKHKKPLYMSNASEEIHQYIEGFQKEKFLQMGCFSEMPVSAMYIPLIVQNRVIGVMAIHSNKKIRIFRATPQFV